MLMPGKNIARLIVTLTVALILLQLPACYYMQAARGHLDVMNQRRPVTEVIADEESPSELKERLELVQQARDFAVDQLLLPDNDSYRSYSDLGRDFVVWNVFAAPEFSLEAKTWCFPVAGCVSYRGYFKEDAAQKFADKLSDQGYDTAVGGVAAYSTLGRFADPVLNTMMRWSDVQLVTTIFHELAHQKLYVKGDSAFNESFATAVANTGIERWLASRNEQASKETIENRQQLRRDVMQLVRVAREDLSELYGSGMNEQAKRDKKRARLQRLSDDAGALIAAREPGLRNWLASPLNNARLVSLGLYEGRQNAFAYLLKECNEDMRCFYDAAESLANLPAEQRRTELESLAD